MIKKMITIGINHDVLKSTKLGILINLNHLKYIPEYLRGVRKGQERKNE